MLNENNHTSLPAIMKTILDNFITYMKICRTAINATLARILEYIKSLSDSYKTDDFINLFEKYSNIWKGLTGNGYDKNSLTILNDLNLEVFINIMIEIIVNNGICPPNRTVMNITGNYILNIMDVYKLTIDSNNEHVMTLGRIMIISYFYFGITLNTDTNTKQSVVNEYFNGFMQMISEDSLTRPINKNENIKFIELTSLLNNLEEKYKEYQNKDAIASQLQHAKRRTIKIKKSMQLKKKKTPYIKKRAHNDHISNQLNELILKLVTPNDEKMEEDSAMIKEDEKMSDYTWIDELEKDVTMLDDMNDNEFNELQETLFKYENKDYDLIENDRMQEEIKPIYLDGSNNIKQDIKEDQIGDTIVIPQSYKDMLKDIS